MKWFLFLARILFLTLHFAACLAGLIVILMMIPTTNFVARFQGHIQSTLMKARDARTALNSEMLGAMKVIKIQAWEENFRTKLLSLRNAELERCV
jgi:hypothetical protein